MYLRSTLFIFVLFFNFQLFASSGFFFPLNDTLTSIEASRKVGQTVLIKGKVISINNMTSKGKRPLTYINIDYPYPQNPITVMIVGENVSKFTLNKQEYLNKEVLIEGIVVKNKGYKPTIFLNDRKQLKLIRTNEY